MNSALGSLLAELPQQKALTAPILEGFSDDTQIKLLPIAQVIAEEGVQIYRRRLRLIEAALAALLALQRDGYPDLPRLRTPYGTLSNFKAQITTLLAALGQIDEEDPTVKGDLTFTKEA